MPIPDDFDIGPQCDECPCDDCGLCDDCGCCDDELDDDDIGGFPPPYASVLND